MNRTGISADNPFVLTDNEGEDEIEGQDQQSGTTNENAIVIDSDTENEP